VDVVFLCWLLVLGWVFGYCLLSGLFELWMLIDGG